MPYLIVKIIMSLSAAALLGFLVAWWWTRLAERRRSNELEGVWTQKVQRANRELDALRADLRTEATRAQGVADVEMTFQAKLSSAENEVTALREQVAALHAKLATASKAAAAAPAAAVSKPGLEEEAVRLRAKVEYLEKDLAAVQTAADSAAAKALEDALASLANRDAEIEQLRRKLEESGKSAGVVREKDDALASVRKMLSERDNELGQWKKKFSDLQSSQSQIASSAAGREAAKVKDLEARYQGMIREKDAALSRMLAQIGELEPLKGKVADSERLAAKAAKDGAEREAAKLKELEVRYQESIREKDAALARMLAQIGELESLKGRAAEAERLAAKVKELEPLTGLPAELAAAESRVATLIEERDAALQAAKAAVPARVARSAKATDDSNDPNRPDDLKKIKGIGPVLEKKLASIGVVSFEQIARWTPDEADAVQKQLPELKDRIRRDNWVAAAREEFTRKYNREL